MRATVSFEQNVSMKLICPNSIASFPTDEHIRAGGQPEKGAKFPSPTSLEEILCAGMASGSYFGTNP